MQQRPNEIAQNRPIVNLTPCQHSNGRYFVCTPCHGRDPLGVPRSVWQYYTSITNNKNRLLRDGSLITKPDYIRHQGDLVLLLSFRKASCTRVPRSIKLRRGYS